MKNHYILYSGSVVYPTIAKNTDEAFAKFFLAIKTGKIKLNEIGQLVICKAGLDKNKDEYPFRTLPTIYNMNMIDKEEARLNIMDLLGINEFESLKMINDLSKQDSWVLDIIKELEDKNENNL